MATYWFKQKTYGYGATPVTWQGWAVVLGGVAAVVGVLLIVLGQVMGPVSSGTLILAEALIVAIVIAIARVKTEGGLRWRWGKQ